jgi:hypothetical protein
VNREGEDIEIIAGEVFDTITVMRININDRNFKSMIFSCNIGCNGKIIEDAEAR